MAKVTGVTAYYVNRTVTKNYVDTRMIERRLDRIEAKLDKALATPPPKIRGAWTVIVPLPFGPMVIDGRF